MAKKGTRKQKQKAADFRKAKIKMGRRLAKPNVTDTSFAAKRIVIGEQLAQSETGTNLECVLSLLRSANKHIVKNAIESAKKTIGWQPADFLIRHVNAAIRSYGAALLSETVCGDADLQAGMYSLHGLVVDKVAGEQLRPHLDLLVAFVACALTHRSRETRHLGARCLDRLLRAQPALCSGSRPALAAFLTCFDAGQQGDAVLLPLADALLQAVYPQLYGGERAADERAVADRVLRAALVPSIELTVERRCDGTLHLCDASEPDALPNLNLVPTAGERDPFYFAVREHLGEMPATGGTECSPAAECEFVTKCCRSVLPRLAAVRMEHGPGRAADSPAATQPGPAAGEPASTKGKAAAGAGAALVASSLRCETALLRQCAQCLTGGSAPRAEAIALAKALRKHVALTRQSYKQCAGGGAQSTANRKLWLAWRRAVDGLKLVL